MKMQRFLLCMVLVLALICPSALAYEELSRGSKGPWVMALQERLNELGYSVGTTDADFGGKTEAMLKQLQKDKGLPETGIADDATWDALYADSVLFNGGSDQYEVRLTPPFSSIRYDDETYTVVMKCFDIEAIVRFLDIGDYSMEDVLGVIEAAMKDDYEGMVSTYQAKDHLLSSSVTEINGREAGLVISSFGFHNEGDLTRYDFTGLMRIDENTAFHVNMYFNLDQNTNSYLKGMFSTNTIKDLLGRIVFPNDVNDTQATGN